MRIDFLVSKLGGGGAERVVSLLADEMDRRGHQVRIITFRDSGDDYPVRPSVVRVKLHKQPLLNSVVLNGLFTLSWFYRKKSNRPDVICSHICLLGYMTIPVARFRGIPVVVSEHINHVTNARLAHRFIRHYMYRLASRVTVLTTYDLEYYRNHGSRVVVMPNPSTFGVNHKSIEDREGSRQIIAVGDLTRYHHKGFDNLILIAKEVFNKHPDWRLKIVGGGDDGMAYLKELVKENAVEEAIEFTGFSNRVKDLLQESEIFVLPSRYEGLPMSLLEAMSQKLACIAYNCVSGPSDIITHEINGLLIPDQDKNAMVAGICRLIEDTELRKKFMEQAPSALDKFSLEKIGDQWDELLSEITGIPVPNKAEN